MKKTISITLNSLIFTLEEDAFNKLRDYLDEIRNYFSRVDSKNTAGEIIKDIEASIAEKFRVKLSAKKQVINLKDVENLIKIMGSVKDIACEESNGIKTETETYKKKRNESEPLTQKKLYRNLDDVVVAGVCSGLGTYFGIDPVIFRIIFVISIFFGGAGFYAYLILWLIMPPAKTISQKLEMQGAPVTLKKLEDFARDKADKLKKVDTSSLKRFLSSPFYFINAIFRALGTFFRKFGRIIGIFFGVIIIVSSVLAMTAVGMAAAVSIFNVNSLIATENFPIVEIVGYSWYIIAVVSGFVVVFIPLMFILLLGASITSRKSAFNAATSSILIGAWMVSIITLGVVLVDVVPRTKIRVNEIINTNTITKNYYYNNINSFRIGATGETLIEKGDEFSLKITGVESALDDLNFSVEGGELKVVQTSHNKGLCLICPDLPIKIEITTPEIESFIAFQRLEAEIKGFYGEKMRINAGESARVKINSSGGELSSYIAGTSGRIEIIGSPEILNAVLEGAGRLTAEELNAREISINGGVLSRTILGGTAEKLNAELEGSARLNAFDLKAGEVKIKTSDYARAEIYPLEYLIAFADNSSRITYKGFPGKIEKKAYNNSVIEMIKDYEFDVFNSTGGVRIEVE